MIIIAAYVAALAVGVAVFVLLGKPLPSRGMLAGYVLWRLAAADGAATVIIFIISLFARNASVYDPYWSVAPPLLLAGLLIYTGRMSVSAVY